MIYESKKVGRVVSNSMYIWPSSDMDFWRRENKDTEVVVNCSRDNFLDYKRLTYQFYGKHSIMRCM